MYIKANFKPKCLNTIENHAFSNEHSNSSRVNRIITDTDLESLDVIFSKKVLGTIMVPKIHLCVRREPQHLHDTSACDVSTHWVT